MSPKSKLFTRIFFYSGIGFGLGMAIFNLILSSEINPWQLLFTGVSFGLFMGLSAVNVFSNEMKKMGRDPILNSDISVVQSRDVVSDVSLNQLIDVIKGSDLFGKMSLMQSESEITLRSGFSWKSWGEEIKITNLNSFDQNQYKIESRPRFKFTVVDYGKNLMNVEKLVQLIGKCEKVR